jgi:hypothetical protein
MMNSKSLLAIDRTPYLLNSLFDSEKHAAPFCPPSNFLVLSEHNNIEPASAIR